MKKIVVLGGAFFALGNVNPAAEANVKPSLLFFFLSKLSVKEMKMPVSFCASLLCVCRYMVTRKQQISCSHVELISPLLG